MVRIELKIFPFNQYSNNIFHPVKGIFKPGLKHKILHSLAYVLLGGTFAGDLFLSLLAEYK
jgi:hypothetical protein